MREYEKYFALSLPPDMWSFCTEESVQAVAGFAVVEKKPQADGYIPLRKLLMCCPANLCWSDARARLGHCSAGRCQPRCLRTMPPSQDQR